MSIETLEDWNERLEACGCCPMPECPAPVVVCQDLNLSLALGNAFDDGDVPVGAFALSLWKAYRTFRYLSSVTLDVDDDDTGSGGFHTIGTGSFEVVYTQTYDSITKKYGCTSEDPELEETLSGDGSFTLENKAIYVCGGVDHLRTHSITTRTFTYLGVGTGVGTIFTPDPDGVPIWKSEIVTESFFYNCDGGVLVADGSEITDDQEGLWSYPSVITTAAAGVHPDRVITNTPTVEDEVTWAGWLADAEAAMVGWIAEQKAEGCWASGSCRALYEQNPPTAYPAGPNNFFSDWYYNSSGININTRPLRFRFRIPHTHLGSKFWITYDVAEFPDDEEIAPSFVSEDNLVEWVGPGTGGSSDPSWLTPWVEIDPPEIPGERRVVNIRYICYHGTKYGSKPQVTGEAFELPPP